MSRPNRGGGRFNKPNERPDNADPTDSSVQPRKDKGTGKESQGKANVSTNQSKGERPGSRPGTGRGRGRGRGAGNAGRSTIGSAPQNKSTSDSRNSQSRGSTSNASTNQNSGQQNRPGTGRGRGGFGSASSLYRTPDSNFMTNKRDMNNQSASSTSSSVNEISKKGLYSKGGRPRSQAPVQNLHMTEQNQDMIHDMLQDLQVDTASEVLDDIDFDSLVPDESYWGRVGDQRLQVQDAFVFASTLDANAVVKETSDEANPYAMMKLLQCGFENQRCANALEKYDGDVGIALEELLQAACKLEHFGKENPEFSSDILVEAESQRQEEYVAIQSIYEDTFTEAIPDRLWIMKLKIPFIEELYKPKPKKVSERTEKEMKSTSNKKNVCRFYLKGNCRYGYLCKQSHAVEKEEKLKDDKHLQQMIEPIIFTLEVRFPEGCIYPYEPPLIAIYSTSDLVPPSVSLNITLRLSTEAVELTKEGLPVVFSIISILEDEEELMKYVERPPSEYSRPEASVKPMWVASAGLQDDVDNSSKDDYHVEAAKGRKQKREVNANEKEALNRKLKIQFTKQKSRPDYKSMLVDRHKLPAWNSKEEIISTLQKYQVLVISGMTGCGKTTQIPQYVLDHFLENGQGAACNIICTQPRRISAMSVAERVAAERADKLGDTIGYKVRLESKQSQATRLLYCTTGILLRYFESDSKLTGVSHVIVDEVHERTEEGDFLMMVLRDLIMERPDLRVVLMSATLDSKLFSEYFYDAPAIHIPGRTFPVQEYYLEDAFEKTGFLVDPNSPFARPVKRANAAPKSGNFKGAGKAHQLIKESELVEKIAEECQMPANNILDQNLNESQMEMRYNDYSSTTISALCTMDHEKINYDLIVSVVEWIVDPSKNQHPKSGAILIFLHGIAEIMSLFEQLMAHGTFRSKDRFCIIPLHSSLSSEEQSLVFKRPKEGITKIVISTNIAETSVTIDDIVYVIDCGKMKENRYDSSKGMESLEEIWVSRANARQRRGRAGRVTSGVCFHMFTRHRYEHNMSQHQIPEIQRVPLEKLCLRIKIMTLFHGRDIKEVLNKLLEPPADSSITDSLSRLHSLGALDTVENLTSLGYHLAALPVDVRIGKLMLLGAIFRCLDPVLTIGAALSFKSPFVAPFDKRDEADKRRNELATGFSDHLTLLKVYNKWLEIMKRGVNAGYQYCRDNFLSMKTLQMIASLKCLFAELLSDIGFIGYKLSSRRLEKLAPRTGDGVRMGTGEAINENADNSKLILAVLCGALYPNVVQVVKPDTKYKASSVGSVPQESKAAEHKFWTKNEGQVFIHPKSVNFQVKYYDSPYLVYHEKVKTSKVYIRDTSMVSVYALLLFCGDSVQLELERGALVVSIDDGWIRFTSSTHQVATLVRDLRNELDRLLADKIETPSLDLVTCPRGSKIIDTISRLIASQ